jgi:hypothetical protein
VSGNHGLWVEVASAQWALSGAVHYNAAQSQWVVDTNLSPSGNVTINGTAETGFVTWNNYFTNFDFNPPYES